MKYCIDYKKRSRILSKVDEITIKYNSQDLTLLELLKNNSEQRINIYIDNDIPSKFLDDIRKVIKPLNLQVFIHMNIAPNEKDFGVSLDRIKHYTYEL